MLYKMFMAVLLIILPACDPLEIAQLLLDAPDSAPLLTTRLTLRPDAESYSADDLNQTREILAARLTGLGLSTAAVTTGDTVIIVELPTVEDFEGTLAALTETGLLELVDFSGVMAFEFEGKRINTALMQYDDGLNHPQSSTPFETVLTSADLQNVTAIPGTYDESWLIQFEVQTEAAQRLGEFTEAHIGETMGIVLNGVVISAPVIQSRLDSAGVISGNFTESEARRLAVQLNLQPLPFPLIVEGLEVIEE